LISAFSASCCARAVDLRPSGHQNYPQRGIKIIMPFAAGGS
jgi:tripartite-type tricarboxylate transporter receptor subunit TctC